MSDRDRQRIQDVVTNRRPPTPVILKGGPADGTTLDFYGDPWSPIVWPGSGLYDDRVVYCGTGRFAVDGHAIYTVDS